MSLTEVRVMEQPFLGSDISTQTVCIPEQGKTHFIHVVYISSVDMKSKTITVCPVSRKNLHSWGNSKLKDEVTGKSLLANVEIDRDDGSIVFGIHEKHLEIFRHCFKLIISEGKNKKGFIIQSVSELTETEKEGYHLYAGAQEIFDAFIKQERAGYDEFVAQKKAAAIPTENVKGALAPLGVINEELFEDGKFIQDTIIEGERQTKKETDHLIPKRNPHSNTQKSNCQCCTIL
ncbi:MAG: hypothetical protein ACHQUC_05725 [Chlamydiales bacterium]